jgi:two-component system, cell cycle response regulator
VGERSDKREKKQRLFLKSKRLYMSDLSAQIAELDGLIAQLQQAFVLESALHVYQIVHKMKGSAPVFGFERAGKIAASLVQDWGWALEEESYEGDLQHLLHQSHEHLLQLKMEQEVSLKDVDLEEQDLQLQHMVSQPVQPPLVSHGRLLLIDDDETLSAYLVRQLHIAGYQVDVAADVETAKRKLREHSYDVITLDLMLYPHSGYELFEFLKEDPTLKWIPLVVLSGKDDLDDKVRCLRLGADDYVTKPFQYEELEARIYSLLKRSKQFEQMAFRDALTGVYNRRYFDHHLQMFLGWMQRDDKPVSLAFLDIDRFKSINDTYGHQIGDMVLQGLGHLLQQNLRTSDLLARYGGEELVVLFPDTDSQTAAKIMTRILGKVRKQPMARHEGQEFFITFSAGVAQWEEGMTESLWIQMADMAMYQAKQAGRDRVMLSGRANRSLNTAPVPAVPKKRLLVADDDPIILSMLRAKLSDLSLDILEAQDGEAAIKVLREKEIDLLILDGIMPKVDGFELLRRMRQDLQRQGVKVLMLSSRKQEEDVVRGLQLGANDYMSKPFSLLELEIRVKRMLGMT